VDAPDGHRLARLTAVACHDMRTPLATVYGFSRTLAGLELGEPAARYVEMIEAASEQVRELLDQLTMVARIETGRFDPPTEEVDLLDLAREAAEPIGDDRVRVSGAGAMVRVPVVETRRALSQLFRAAQRHGGLDSVGVEVDGCELRLGPITRTSEGVLLGSELRELGAASAAALVQALGGELEVENGRLAVRLPSP
jgi:signal transduction histidine kinase